MHPDLALRENGMSGDTVHPILKHLPPMLDERFLVTTCKSQDRVSESHSLKDFLCADLSSEITGNLLVGQWRDGNDGKFLL